MFGVKAKKEECERLSDSLKAKISELHLQIRSGTLTPTQLAMAEALLKRLQAQNAGTRGDSERRVRPPGPNSFPPAPAGA
jgi:hypothetical protein